MPSDDATPPPPPPAAVPWRAGLRRWGPLGIVAGIALLRAFTVPIPTSLPPTTEKDQRAIFEAIASKEPEMRKKAAKDFPTEPWSADDDFHSYELQDALAYAHVHRYRYGDVLAAIDMGIRSKWPTKGGVVPKATVVPCQPRPIY